MNTVYIIGAGASADFKLPIGSELKAHIADILYKLIQGNFDSREVINFYMDRLRCRCRHGLKFDKKLPLIAQ